nr:methyltransferase domain-containing protein [Paracraurococcus ruber]
MPPGGWFDAARHYASTYGRDHWGAHDPADPGWPAPGSARRLLEAALPALPDGPGLVLELGCAAGGVTHALADIARAPVLGLDLSAPLARIAQRALQQGLARYPLRLQGTEFALRQVAVPPPATLAETWIADAMAPPLPAGCARLVVALNLLDCVADPRGLLAAIARLLRPGGVALVGTPFDWSPNATPAEAWPGARAQREPTPALAELLDAAGLRPLAPARELDWTLRLHARAAMTYRASILCAERGG